MSLRIARLAPCAGLALLALLCAAAGAQAAKGGARERLSTRKVLEDLAWEPAPAPAPALDDFDGNDSMLAAPMATRENAFQSGAELAVDVAQELLGTCVWGNYCGGKCDGVKEGKEPLSTSEDGGLDQACYEHDRCLEENRDLEASTYCAASGTPNCFCDSQLASKAWDIYNSNKKDCALWDLTCWEYGFVMAARNVALSQEYRQYCGSCN